MHVCMHARWSGGVSASEAERYQDKCSGVLGCECGWVGSVYVPSHVHMYASMYASMYVPAFLPYVCG